MKRLSIYFICLLLSFPCLAEALPEYGLYIQAYPHPNTEFTELLLNNGEPINIKNQKFQLNFSLYNRAENVFGCVFRMISSKGLNLDLMYSVGADDSRYPILVIGEKTYTLSGTVKLNTWINVELSIDPKLGSLDLHYDDLNFSLSDEVLKDFNKAQIDFGNCTIENYILSDVASVNLKDIVIKLDNKTIRHWKLALYNNNICYDEIVGSPAISRNPNWLINKYVSWTKIYHKDFKISPSIAFDPTVGTFYIAGDSKNIDLFYPSERRSDMRKVYGGVFAATFPNQLIYIPQSHKLLSYNLDENIYSPFDFMSSTWDNSIVPSLEHDYWNNTITYYQRDSALVSFGGYGHYHFNNILLISYPFSDKKQEKIVLDSITPRYSSASTIIDDTLYIFGGRGNLSGRQELSPRNYYDLYAVDLDTKEVSKLWEITQADPGNEFHPSGNLVYDKDNDCFYVITNLHSGKLLKISRTEPSLELMSLSIEAPFSAQYIYSNLHYASGPNMLYTVIQETKVNGDASVDIYELAYPPISVKSLEQNAPKERKGISVWIIGVAFILGLGLYKLLSKPKKMVTTRKIDKSIDTESLEAAMSDKLHYDFSKQCICLFGGFKVIDKDGNNITSLFTPTLKTMLIMLILHNNGISGNKMISLMWGDKTDDSAKNSRNVYLSKLRVVLDKIGGVKIVSESNHWSIQFDDNTLCDYTEALRLRSQKDIESLSRLLELLLQGVMLPDMEIDWIDKFKSDFSSSTIDLLSTLLMQDGFSDEFRLRIANTLFQHDFINEDALFVTCRILCGQGKKSLAKVAYDRFCKEYTNMMGTEYGVKFSKITDSLI